VRQPERQSTSRGDAVRARLIAAALERFAAVGFEGASTRDIADAAATHQPQINYHFGSKLGLWKAAIDSLFEDLDADMDDLPDDPVEMLIECCKRFTRFAARRPELNRIMVHESTIDSERLDWIVATQVRQRFAAISAMVARLDPARVPTADPVIFYYSLIGASSLLAVNAPEARRLIGGDPLRDRIEAHADAVAAMLLGSYVGGADRTAVGAATRTRSRSRTASPSR
jgi:TetR/AcrR family transcriptional regulator